MRNVIFFLVVSVISLLFFVSCSSESDQNNVGTMSMKLTETETDTMEIFDYDQSFNVYEQGANDKEAKEFSIEMYNNPISTKMNEEINNNNFSTDQDIQKFYINYVSIWKNELSFSIKNLKLYLNTEEKEQFEIAQKNWENSLLTNMNFDNFLITSDSSIYYSLGSQYIYSYQIYLMDQYMYRTFHIKYMTYLIEKNLSTETFNSNTTWDMFFENN